ncbi:MAG: hypothetical protein ACNA7G_00480 [Methylobacter sp.]
MKISQCLLLLVTFLATSAFAGEAPLFQNQVLTIPHVDTEAQAGRYQNVQFRLADDGRWDLQAVTEVQPATVESSEVLVVDSKPVQVFAKVSGYFPSGCYGLASINVRRRSVELFEVLINQVQLQTIAICTQALVPFSLTVPLDVYGLAAGTYQVSVHGGNHVFTLATDNNLPE